MSESKLNQIINQIDDATGDATALEECAGSLRALRSRTTDSKLLGLIRDELDRVAGLIADTKRGWGI
ncbi:hypothetical protein CLV78_105224 [Aliiruegeria haliotis]|uniref:Uncharacterized protein n=1 Tax=Aliiruegeria haliotis TaxID=1280846 RepID=A0A2T0RPZ0_9RHOB|nr:hypothetical protein [Aliiruegeria haliotis]PRY23170.1 hypothetical protein CLV78_105224 [Aliiruegeria haliotis]